MSHHQAPRWRKFLQQYSIPLLFGVFAALVAANLFEEHYHHWIDAPIAGLGLSLHFLVNDIFMVLFFGIAAKEITTSCLPGGDLNPFRKAINPLCGTLGGVYGPILVYLGLVFATDGWHEYAAGWGVPTATDIALAWLVARAVFGAKHPAVNYLLLLAVADDAIGLGIIAIAYPDLAHPTAPEYLGLVAAAMGVAYLMRKRQVQHWAAYVLGPGSLAWWGLHAAHLHPALALVFVVPFMPGRRDHEPTASPEHAAAGWHDRPSTLDAFEHTLKMWVDFGLFFFAFANAGVAFSHVGPGTWYVFFALVVGKTVGVTTFGWLGTKIGFPLPAGMSLRHLFVAGMVAGLGLTVALFVAGEAFEGVAQAEAKMGALFSILVAGVALVAGRVLRVSQAESLQTSRSASLAPSAYVEEEEPVLDEA